MTFDKQKLPQKYGKSLQRSVFFAVFLQITAPKNTSQTSTIPAAHDPDSP
jgi:hypothetical protein